MKITVAVMVGFCSAASFAQQMPDTAFDVGIARPFYAAGRSFWFDEAHRNFHRSNGTYLPFVKLLKNDGLRPEVNRKPFDSVHLDNHPLLVIANPMPAKDTSAYTAREIEAVYDYVQKGGSLLVITDHFPVSKLNEALLTRFGVQSTIGTVEDSVTSDNTVKGDPRLLFSRQNGLLADNAFTGGVSKVISFTGQGVKGPAGSVSILNFSGTAYYQPVQLIQERRGDELHIKVRSGKPVSALGWSQAIALQVGRGRLIVTGEAAMLTAQRDARRPDDAFGMNYGGNDNKTLLLNMIHWLLPSKK